jgi:hypothetical protein
MPDEPGDHPTPGDHPEPPDHHHHGAGGRRTIGDYARDFFTNWESYEGPLAEKITLTLKNRAKAYAPPFKGCCGHPGEPGC